MRADGSATAFNVDIGISMAAMAQQRWECVNPLSFRSGFYQQTNQRGVKSNQRSIRQKVMMDPPQISGPKVQI